MVCESVCVCVVCVCVCERERERVCVRASVCFKIFRCPPS